MCRGCWPRGPEEEIEAIRRAVGARFEVEAAPASGRATLLDTFDRRLGRKGLALWRTGTASRGRLELEEAGQAAGLSVAVRQATDFARDLPAGPLRARLEPLLENRRLLPLALFGHGGEQWDLRDEEGKIVARLGWRERWVQPPEGGGRRRRSLSALWWLEGLRGYEEAVEALAAELSERLGGAPVPPASWVVEGLEAVGVEPVPSWLGRRVELDPEEPAGGALRRWLALPVAALEVHRPGTLAALDAEFLHDFRVALRRIRSAFRELPRLESGRAFEPLRVELSWLGRATGPRRDLDVLLEALDSHRLALPTWAQPGVDRLEHHLHRRAQRAQRDLVRVLTSTRYRRLVAKLERLSQEAARPEEPPALAFARKRLRRAARHVAVQAAAITPETPPEPIHQLRIVGKRYRYLLELFASLFPAEGLAAEIKALKELQDLLGSYNDLAVQAETLRALALDPGGSALPALEVLTLGYWIAQLDAQRAALFAELREALEHYLAPENRQRERELFG
jgi:CHAD domain-containing protein